MTIRYISVYYIYGHSGGVLSRAHLYSYIAYHSILNISTLWIANIYRNVYYIYGQVRAEMVLTRTCVRTSKQLQYMMLYTWYNTLSVNIITV